MYEMTALFWYKFVFLTELLIAEALTVHKLKRRNMFALRLVLSMVLCYGVAAAIPIVSYDALYCSFMFLAMFALTVIGMAVCFKAKPLEIIFCAIAGYTTQHVAYELYDLSVLGITGGNAEAFSTVYGENPIGMMPVSINFGAFQAHPNPLLFLIYFFIYGVTYLLSYMFTSSRMGKDDALALESVSITAFSGLFFLFNILMSAVVIYRSRDSFDFVYIAMLQVYNIFCCLIIMYLMFETALRKRIQSEKNAVSRLWIQAGKQYAFTKENIEYINIKCHDLKHKIRAIGAGNIDGSALAELESTVSAYDSNIKSGNGALDVILTEKSIYCTQHGIELDCMADGSRLGFMSNEDMYSLFGNLVDNAIEAVEKTDDKHIDLSVRTVNGGFVKIYISNKCAVAPVFDGRGLPVTTKADKLNHGFGMKSVKYVCDKYDGHMTATAADGRFTVTAIFAMPADRT